MFVTLPGWLLNNGGIPCATAGSSAGMAGWIMAVSLLVAATLTLMLTYRSWPKFLRSNSVIPLSLQSRLPRRRGTIRAAHLVARF
jgi:hypothetical protein